MRQHNETEILTEAELRDIATQVLENLPVVFAVISIPDCRFQFLNEYTLDYLRKMGLENPSGVLGQHPQVIVYNWDETICPAIQQVVSSGQVGQLRNYPFEWMGMMTYWDVALVPYFDEYDETTSISLIATAVTERSKAETALTESEELLGDILNSISAHIAVIDTQGTIIAVNEAWNRFAIENGDPSLEHTGVGVNYIGVCRNAQGEFSEGAEEVLHGLQSILNGSLDRFEIEYPCPSPTEQRWYYLRATPLGHGQNGAVTAHVDITKLKLTENALRESEHKFKAIFDNAGDAIFILDLQARLIDVNHVAVDRLGYSRDELLRMTAMDVDAPEYAARVEERIAELCRQGYSLFETVHVRRDRTTFPVEVNLRLIEYDGRPAVLAIARDITRRKQIENALKESEERFRLVIANSPDTIFVHDRDLRYIQVYNAVAPASAEQLLGRTDFEVFPRKEAENLTEIKRTVLATETGTRVELLLTIAGSKRLYDVSYEPWKDADGRVVGIAGYARDITGRKQAEEELKKARDAAERESWWVTAMESIAQAGISPMAMDDLLRTLAERIDKGLNADSGAIMLLDEKTGELVGAAAPNLPQEVGFRIKTTEGFVGKVITEQRTIYVEDAGHDPLVVSPHIKRSGAKSLLGTPLITRGEVMGVAYIATPQVRTFSPEEVRLFELMAARAALIIDNARLYDELVESREEVVQTLDREVYFSHVLQQALLPPRPMIGPGYVVADRYVPGYAEREVGGDFYDVFTTETDCAAILIGDVSGKGVEAASFAAATRSTARAFAYEMLSAGESLIHTNRVLYPQGTESELFATIFLAVLDLPTGRLRYASAGHPPPAIYRAATSSVEFLEFGDPPVGLLDTYLFREYESHLEPGDKILLYTDGLSEARRDSMMFGTEGIQAVLEQHGGLAPDDLINALLDAARAWDHGAIADDTAIIVVERSAD